MKPLLLGFVFFIDLALSTVAVDIFGPPSLFMPDLPFAGSEISAGAEGRKQAIPNESWGERLNCERHVSLLLRARS